MDAVLDFQSGIRDLATVIFEGYEAMGIVDDAAPYIEAASEKGYKEFNSGGVKIATDWDPSLKQRVRVPVRGRGRRILDQAENATQGIAEVAQGVGYRARGAAKSAQAKLTPAPREGLNFATNLDRGMKKLGRGADAAISDELGKMGIQAGLDIVAYSFESIGKEIADMVISAFKAVTKKKRRGFMGLYAKADPMGAASFNKAFDVASNNFVTHGIEEGAKKTSEYMDSVQKSLKEGSKDAESKIRGMIAGVGAVTGGLIQSARTAASSAKKKTEAFIQTLPIKVKTNVGKLEKIIDKMPMKVKQEGAAMFAATMGMIAGMQAALMNSGNVKAVGNNFGLTNEQMDSILSQMNEKASQIEKSIPASDKAALEEAYMELTNWANAEVDKILAEKDASAASSSLAQDSPPSPVPA